MSGGIITAAADFAALQQRLLAQALALGAARAAAIGNHASPAKWRSARALWPLFGQE